MRKTPRKVPQQSRSGETLAAIVEATDRVVIRLGSGGVTTTRVAAAAGVSIGTLYQYFPSKAALLAAWEERTLGILLDGLKQHIVGLAGQPVEQLVNGVALEGIDAVARMALLYRFNEEALFAARAGEKMRLAEETATFLTQRLMAHREFLRPVDLKLAMTVVVKTAVTMAFIAAAEHPDDVKSGAFQYELATMITRYLLVDERFAALGKRVSLEPSGG